MLEKLWLQIAAQVNMAVFLSSLGKIVLIIILVKVFVRLTRSLVENVFLHSLKSGLFGEEKRIQTMKTLLKSIVSYSLYFIAGPDDPEHPRREHRLYPGQRRDSRPGGWLWGPKSGSRT